MGRGASRKRKTRIKRGGKQWEEEVAVPVVAQVSLAAV